MKNFLKILLVGILLFSLSGCLDAKAEKVSLDQTVYLLANSEPIGKILEYGASVKIEFNNSFDAVKVWADGRMRLDPQILLFSEPDCQGEAYVRGDFSDHEPHVPFKLKRSKGKIFPCDASICGEVLYYLPPNEEKYYFVGIASQSNGGCSNYTDISKWYYYKVLPNDPAVTGINKYPFPLPLTFRGMEELELRLVE